MTRIMHLSVSNQNEAEKNLQAALQKDILQGFTKAKKQIPSKYFYDKQGSELFNQITRHPDYYLTGCELEILKQYRQDLARYLGREAFNLIELGPGEGIKTQLLIEQFLTEGFAFSYVPIDISASYLEQLTAELAHRYAHIKLKPMHSDFFHGVEWLSLHTHCPNVVLFLGSSIGNYTHQEALDFLQQLWRSLNDGDYLLMGFDLRKDISILMRAYDDNKGITRAFNLNLLLRLNRELESDFVLDQFSHYATYNIYTNAMESYLVSMASQQVVFKKLNKTFHFGEMEPIHVECSYKYSLEQIQELAYKAGFEIIKNYTDRRQYFVETLWRVNK